MKQIKSRKLHHKDYKEIVIEPELIKSQNSREKNNINKEISIPVLVILVILVSVISGCLGAYFMLMTYEGSTTTTTAGATTSTAALNETNSISEAVSKVYDTVVVVEVYNDNQLASTGTGFVYKKTKNKDKIYLMTNNHVISGGETIKVLFTDGTELDAKVVGSDTYSDIAVLSVDDSVKIVTAIMGESEKSKIGDTLFTVGSPEGSDYAGTVTKGILSAKERLVAVALESSTASDYYMEVLQTDAAINPGNSGGPLLNVNGEVIGVISMKLVEEQIEGIGFAIPIEFAMKHVKTLEEGKKIEWPIIGISMVNVSDKSSLYSKDISLPNNLTVGVVITEVFKDSNANNSGLKKGDVIVAINDEIVKNIAYLRYELFKYKPGDTIQLTIFRNGKQYKVSVKLSK